MYSRPQPGSSPAPALPHGHLQQSPRARADILQGALRNNCWKSNRCPFLFNRLLIRKTGGLEQPQRRLPGLQPDSRSSVTWGTAALLAHTGWPRPSHAGDAPRTTLRKGVKKGCCSPSAWHCPGLPARRATLQPQPHLRSPQRAVALRAGRAPTSCQRAGSGKREAGSARRDPTRTPPTRRMRAAPRLLGTLPARGTPTEASRRARHRPAFLPITAGRRPLPSSPLLSSPILPLPGAGHARRDPVRPGHGAVPPRVRAAEPGVGGSRGGVGARARAAPEGETLGEEGGDGCGEGGAKVAVRAGPWLEALPGGGERAATSWRRRRREVRRGAPADLSREWGTRTPPAGMGRDVRGPLRLRAAGDRGSRPARSLWGQGPRRLLGARRGTAAERLPGPSWCRTERLALSPLLGLCKRR